MKTSSYFDEALFYRQSPAANNFFNERSSTLFELDENRASLDILIQGGIGSKSQDGIEGYTILSTLDAETSWYPETPLSKQRRVYQDDTSRCRSPVTLPLKELSDVKSLKEAALASAGKFRICFIKQRHSYSRLGISQTLFDTMMTEFHIFPRFKEFVTLFGAKHQDNEIKPPQLRFRRFEIDSIGPDGSPGVGFECAYISNYVALNSRRPNMPWSIRKTAIYHCHDTQLQCSTWVMVAPSESAKSCLDQYISTYSPDISSNPFEIHVILLDDAIVSWRPYINYIAESCKKMCDQILVASLNEKRHGQPLELEIRQELKDLDYQLVDILALLCSTSDTISLMMQKYKQFRSDCSDLMKQGSNIELDSVHFALEEKQTEVRLSLDKVRSLSAKINGLETLLSDLGGGYAIRLLTEEAQKESTTMRKISENSARDAAAVKVLTIITLIYLPASVVLNFFSTQFVASEQDGELVLAANAWLFAAISLPLTALTFVVWWLWVKIQAGQLHTMGWVAGTGQTLANLLKSGRKWRHTSLDLPKGRANMQTELG